MVSKYRRLLQHDTSEENENGEMENTRQQQKKQTNIRSCKASVRASDEDEDDEIVLDELHEEEDVTEGEGGQKKVSDAHSAGASADAAAPSVRRFGKGRKEVDSATLSVGDHEDEVDVKSDQTASREGYARNSVDAKDHKNKNKFVVDGKEEKEDEDEEDVDAGEDQEEDDDDDDANAKDTAITGGCGPRLYSCDACPHAVFTTHTALLSHVEERHAELVPDHARLHRIAEKFSKVWSRALKARRDAIALWGKKVFAVAVQRDAGEEKMQEAHRARAQLELVVRRWHEKARVFIFGSSVAMGVWDGMADIDFAVVDVEALDAGNWPPLEKNAVRSITELLRRAGFSFVNLEPISHARVPIIKHHASSPILTVARKDAEDIVARSVRFVLNAPASREDRVMLEGSVRDAVGPAGVQQVWWNRTGDVMSMTLENTTTAIRAAICSPAFVTPTLRAKVQPVHDECRPELYNVDFDLSFRAFGIRNSNLLRQYLMSHPCARPGAIVLKDWSKTSGVNNSVNGYFTSYAVNIMWIYYLIQKKYVPYVDPLDIPASLINETNFDPKYIPMVDPTLTQEELDVLYQNAGNMLVGFFYFYSFEFDWEHHVISLNRPGITTKKMLGWHVEDVVPPMSSSLSAGVGGGVNSNTGGVGGGGAGATTKRHPTRYELCIEDPYEENLNLGRHIGITKSLRVRTELYRGLLSLLKDGEKESCVFASTDLAESADATGPLSSKLPVRALFRLMALATQAIAESKRFSSMDNASGDIAGDGEVMTSTSTGTAVGLAPSSQSKTSSTTGMVGRVSEKQLENIFLEKAALEYQLTRKVWNWQQLIHRLGYKIHRGQVLPRRELGVRCIAKRDADESLNDMHGSKNPAVRGQDLTESILRDLSRGFMTLTPEWVAWSKPWASQHLRGYSRLTTTADHLVSADASVSTSNKGVPSGGEPAMGLMRGTRRNAFPMIGMRNIPISVPMPMMTGAGVATTIARMCNGVKRFLPLKFIR
ncbi:putative RNA editing 3' terminal uridylyl transferase 1 [Trypanosoma cruzi]|uniref:RNA uridylyltransferase n=2 Tax=Trypanosoma cruzi TaxID=5693 RepID=Q4D425_TRYCC|nr:RNA editing 3' terminal uridylyl transferase 1, putative [Trypanosoma cruzi]EAN87279.1 RNA editing 3' terminal uridylyl transferase 1, putative [Trypanosoma cruzi]PWV07439.1 putative RNA editing 3' terminal uridylyl transferase 1 [Trypanosoma cruzi]|eukprot:XP_809130.1 RNA editing 3' terminal uridylyl transferase 1 [Trypanosoma cruzi strain CL Brener]